MRGDCAQFKSAIGVWGLVVSSEFLARKRGFGLFWISLEAFQICCLTVAKCLDLMGLIPESSWKLLKRVQGTVHTSGFFRFGVKSFDPIRNAVHLKSDHDLRVPSCPRQERM